MPAASATAVVSEPPRPSVVTSSSVETPWKPATSTIVPWSSAAWIRFARTSTIFALPCTVSVTIPACEPVSEIASWPRSLIAIAASAQEIRSPTEISMSSSRGWGLGEIRCARSISSSVVWPIAERTATTRLPRLARRDQALRDRLQLLGVADGRAAELQHDGADGRALGVALDGGNGLEVGGGHRSIVGEAAACPLKSAEPANPRAHRLNTATLRSGPAAVKGRRAQRALFLAQERRSVPTSRAGR